MTIDNPTPKKIHQGRNIKRFREILGIKQEALAFELDITQATMSKLEAKEVIEDLTLQKIADILKVPTEAIKNFDDELAINVISNTINNNDNATMTNPAVLNYQPSFNPVDKMVELYERMLQQQKEMIDKLEKLIVKQ